MVAHSSRTSGTSVETLDRSIDAPGSAFDSLHGEGGEIQVSGSGALPATGRLLGRAIYSASYAVSFGVTFPVMMVVRIVPRDNALVHGLVDGAAAARDRVYGWPEEMVEHQHDEDGGAHASENGSAHHDEGSGHATTRRPRAKRAATRKPPAKSSRKKG